MTVLQRYLDGSLDGGSLEALEAHLELCRDCGIEYRTYREIRSCLCNRRLGVPADAIERMRVFATEVVPETVRGSR